MILELEVNVIRADASAHAHTIADLYLVSNVWSGARDDLALIELRHALFGRQGWAARRRRRHGVAVRPVPPQVVLHRAVDADTHALPNANIDGDGCAGASTVLDTTDVDDR